MKKTFFLLIITALLFSACRSSKPITNRYYVLEISTGVSESLSPVINQLQGMCLVQTVDVAPVFSSYQIAVREESHSIRYFTFHEWAQRPETMMTGIIIDYLKTNDVFEQTEYGRLRQQADYILETKVHLLEIDNQEDYFRSRLDIEFSLTEAASGTVLHHHRANRSEQLAEKNLNYFAVAISDMFTEELITFLLMVMDDKKNR